MSRETIELFGGDRRLYKREKGGQWQCSAYLNGRNHRTSTKTGSLARAREAAEDWLLRLRGKSCAGLLKAPETTINAAAINVRRAPIIKSDALRSLEYR